MKYGVLLTDDAVHDLEGLFDFIENHDSLEKAVYVLDQLEKSLDSLTENPKRGTYVNELLALGIREYREIFFKPYRIIYQVSKPNVYVLVIADGRRDMQSLLQRRLLKG